MHEVLGPHDVAWDGSLSIGAMYLTEGSTFRNCRSLVMLVC